MSARAGPCDATVTVEDKTVTGFEVSNLTPICSLDRAALVSDCQELVVCSQPEGVTLTRSHPQDGL